MAILQPFSIQMVCLLLLVVPCAGKQEARDFETLMTQALEARREGRLEEAATAFRQAARIRPDSSGVHYVLARVLFEQELLLDALAAVEQALVLDPDKAPYHFLRGAIFDTLGNMSEAIAGYENSIRLDPALSQAYLSLGISYLRGEEFDKSARALGSFLEMNPDDPNALYYLAGALGEQDQTTEALGVLERLLRSESDHAGGWLLRARLEAKQRDAIALALESYQKALALDPENARAHYELGMLLEKRGQPEEAMTAFRRASELSPEMSEASFALGKLLNQQGRTEEARAHLERFKSQSDQEARRREQKMRATASFGKGQELLAENRFEEAAAAFREVIEAEPKSHRGYAALARAHRALGEVDAAVGYILRAIELAPGAGEYSYLLSIILRDKRDLTGALAAAERAVTLAPQSGPAHNGLGVILGDMGDDQGAVAAFEKAVELDSQNAAYSLNLASAYAKIGDTEKSDEAMERYREQIAASTPRP